MSTLLGFVVLLGAVYGQYDVMEIPTSQSKYLTAPAPLPRKSVYETEISPPAHPQTSSASIVNAQDEGKYLTAPAPVPRKSAYETDIPPSGHSQSSSAPIANAQDQGKYLTAPAPLPRRNVYETEIPPSKHPQTSGASMVNAQDQGKYLTAPAPLPRRKVYETEISPSAYPLTSGASITNAQNQGKYKTAPAPLPSRNVYETEVLPSARPQTSSAPIVNTEDEININVNNNNQECGISVDHRQLVFSGRFTKVGENPWLAAMFYLNQGNYGYRCGASIISNNLLVTAAHCMKDQNGVKIKKEFILIVMGKQNIKNWAIGSTIRGVNEYIIHPDFKNPSDADIAVIILDNPVTFSMTIKPICLWDESIELHNIVGQNGSVAGWGRDETGREYVDEPRQISMPIASYENCLWADNRFVKLTSNRTFCAGDRNGHVPCTGDSGSGFILKRNGKWYLRGVVSIALADLETLTCDINNYAVFSDVAKFDKWLRYIMETS